MKNSFIKFTISIFIVFSTIFCVEFVSFGNDINEIAGDARYTAMGGVGTSIKSKSALFINPSLIVFNDAFGVAFTKDIMWNGFVENTQIVVNPAPNGNYVTNYGILIRSVDNIHNTENAWVDDGNPPNGDINYQNIDFFNHQEITGYISISKKTDSISDIYSIGVSVKPSLIIINDEYSIGLGMDIGAYSAITDEISIGCVVQDLFSYNSWSTGNSELYYPKLKFGIQYNHNNFVKIGADFGYLKQKLSKNLSSQYAIGTDFHILNGFNLYLGKSNLYSWTTGFKMQTDFLEFMYSITPNKILNELGYNHKISLIFDFKGLHKLTEGITP